MATQTITPPPGFTLDPLEDERTPAERNNNPGNIREPKTGEFRSYGSPEEGFEGLVSDIEAKQAGKTTTGLHGGSTLYDFAAKYAPKADKNDPVRYAQNVAKRLNLKPEATIGEIHSRDLAAAVAEQEDSKYWKTISGKVNKIRVPEGFSLDKPTSESAPDIRVPEGFTLDAPVSYDTKLATEEEQNFQEWKKVNAPNDSGEDYDLRGAFKAGLKPGSNGHWPDTYKKPNHPTFSSESIYAGPDAPTWRDNLLVDKTGRVLAQEPSIAEQKAERFAKVPDLDKQIDALHASIDARKPQLDAEKRLLDATDTETLFQRRGEAYDQALQSFNADMRAFNADLEKSEDPTSLESRRRDLHSRALDLQAEQNLLQAGSHAFLKQRSDAYNQSVQQYNADLEKANGLTEERNGIAKDIDQQMAVPQAAKPTGQPQILAEEAKGPTVGFISPQLNRPVSSVPALRAKSNAVPLPFYGDVNIPGAGRAKEELLQTPVIGDAARATHELREILYDPAQGGALKSDSDVEKVINGFLRGAAALNTPEAIATWILGAGLTRALPILANAPRMVALLSKYPTLAKGIDIASRNAVSTAFGAIGTVAGVKDISAGVASGDLEKTAQGIFDLGMGGFALAHAFRGGQETLGAFPKAENKAAADPMAEEFGVPPKPTEQQTATARQKAETLAGEGRGLAAKQWEDIAQYTKPLRVDIGGGAKATIIPMVEGRYRSFNVVDETGTTIVAGDAQTIQHWLRQRRVVEPSREAGGAISVGSGAAEIAEQPAISKPAQAPISAGRPETALNRPDTTESPVETVAEPTKSPKNKVASREIAPGAVFETDQGTYTVWKVLGDRVLTTLDFEGKRSMPVIQRSQLEQIIGVQGDRPTDEQTKATEPVSSPATKPEPTSVAQAEPEVPRETQAETAVAPESTKVEPHKFASTQVNLPQGLAGDLRNAGAHIPESQLADDGREAEPHITVKYGLHGDDHTEVSKLLEGEPPITATLGKASIFHTDEADVLKVDVDSPDLHRLNAKIATLPHTDTHPDYKPHVTIAYLKKGEGKQYEGRDIPNVTGKQITLNSVVFSGKDRSHTEIPLTGNQSVEPATPSGPPTSEPAKAPEPAKPDFKTNESVFVKVPGGVIDKGKVFIIEDHGSTFPERWTVGVRVKGKLRHFAPSSVGRDAAELRQRGTEKPLEQQQAEAGDQVGGDASFRSNVYDTALEDLKQAHMRLNGLIENQSGRFPIGPDGTDDATVKHLKRSVTAGEEILEKIKPLEGPKGEAVANALREAIKYAKQALAKGEIPEPGKVDRGPFNVGDRVEVNLHSGRSGNYGTVIVVGRKNLSYRVKTDDGVEHEARAADVTRAAVMAHMQSFKAEVQVTGEGDKWLPNGLAFPTREEAEKYAADLYSRWTLTTAKRVVESSEEPNYNWTDGQLVKIEAQPEQPKGAAGLVGDVYRTLKSGGSLGNVTEFNKLAEKNFGSSRTSGAWTPKDAFDAMEAGVNKYLLENKSGLMDESVDQGLADLRELMGQITSQGVRTDEQIKNQQFSTPPTEAYTAVRVANVQPDDVMLEPSAGNGGIAVFAKMAGATVYVNEISERRAAMLDLVGLGPSTGHDGEIINALLDPSIQPTVIVMNPPFSAGTVKSGEAKNDNKYGFNHVESALQRLVPGGRLVAILGGGQANEPNGGASLQGIASGKWFQKLAKLYNIRANVRISGKEYQKYGTNFATRIIVIDKDGPTKAWNNVVGGNVETLEEAYNLLKDVAQSRPQTQIPARSGSQEIAGQGQSGTGVAPSQDAGSPSGGGVQPGGAGASGPGQLGAAPSGSRGGSRGGQSSPRGQRTGLRQPGNRPVASPQNLPSGPAGGSTENASAGRPLASAPPKEVSKEDILDKARNLVKQRAEEAKQRLRDKMSGRTAQSGIDPQDLVDLATIGADYVLEGAITLKRWSAKFLEAVGDLVGEISAKSGVDTESILRQVHERAQEVAEQLMDDARAALQGPPPETPDLNAPLTGNETAEERIPIERTASLSKAEREDSEAYVTYVPSLKGPAHPGAIVETKTMATVPLPDITKYKPNLPRKIVDEGRLSGVQLEAAVIAGMQNSSLLPSGAYASALIGDGTGVGKGREAATILWDNYRQGRKRLVWVSEKWDLMQDALRDIKGIGADDLMRGVTEQNGKFVLGANSAMTPFKKYNANAKINHDGVLFTTYALIRSEDNKGNQRVNQLEEYLRGDDDGEGAYILFDESHALKNAVANQGGQVSQIGSKVKALLDRMPKLRTVSLSATAATDVVNLGYLDRLGLWGPGTPFPNGFGEFQTQVAPGGVAAMEMIARELKAQGKYLSRTLSFNGVKYTEEDHKLTDEQKELYRTAARAWASVFRSAETTITQTTNGGGRQKSRFMSQFYGAQQRFFNLLITTLKIPTAIELANKALAEDKSVVITLVNTNEAAQNREKNKAAAESESDEPIDYDFGPKELLIDLVEQHYPIQQYRDDVDSAGNPIKVPVTRVDPESGREVPVHNPEAKAARDALIAQIKKDLNMPDNPLDILVQSLGGDKKVAELTGRKEKYDRNVEKFIPRGDPSAKRDEVNLFEMRAFQSGKKRVAILSAAAGTGISLHAGNDVANQQPRYHITLQVGWSADKQMQMFGRTHRTNQKHPPEYVMLVSDLGGERRFVSTIARRLGSLGALTKGQKNATTGTDLMEKVNFETDQGRQATNSFYEALLHDQPVPGTGLTGMSILEDLHVLKDDPQVGKTVPREDRTNVTRLLNRLLALDPDIQNAVYNFFYDIFQAAVQDAIDRGTLDTGVKTLPGDEFSVKEQRVLSKDPDTGAETIYYPVDAKIRLSRVSPEDLDKRLKQYKDDHPRFLYNPERKTIALSIDANPIVHADGKLETASYIATPGNGKWQKTANSRLYRTPELATWAAEQAEKLQRELRIAESSVDYYQRNVEESTARERTRRAANAQYELDNAQRALEAAGPQSNGPGVNWQGPPKEQAQARVEAARKALEEARNFEYPDTGYPKANLVNAQREAAEKRAAYEEANSAATDPVTFAKSLWAEQYESAPTHTTQEHHLIGGAVMKFWNPIKDATFVRNSIFTTTDSKTGQRVVGIDIPEPAIGQLIQRIAGGASTVNADQLETDILRNNLEYTLEGGIRVARGRVAREFVIQVFPPSQDILRNLQRLGVLSERGAVPTHYIPNRHDGPAEQRRIGIVRAILRQYPVQPTQATPVRPALRTVQFALGQKTAKAGLSEARIPRAVYRNGIVWTNGATVDFLSKLMGSGNASGLYLPPNQAEELVEKLQNVTTPSMQATGNLIWRALSVSLRNAVQDAQQDKGHVIVIGYDKGDALENLKSTVRHERFHAVMQKTFGRAHGIMLLGNPLAKRALANLALKGYEAEPVTAWHEIGAHLASGPDGWMDLGLNRQEAKDLFGAYLNLLDTATIAMMKHVAPQLNEVIRARQAESDIRRTGVRDYDPFEASATAGQLRPSLRRDVSRDEDRESIAERIRKLASENGGALNISRLTEGLRARFGDDAPLANYSGMGAMKDIFVRNLSQLEEASSEGHTAAVRKAASKAQTAAILRAAVPEITKALEGSGITWDDMRLALIESRLRGTRERWERFADQAENMPEAELRETFTAAFGGLLQAIEGKRGLPFDMAQTAAALASNEEWDILGPYLNMAFSDAADAVSTVMPDERFAELTSEPKFQTALGVYKRLVEGPMADNHSLNEGIFSDALGPLDTYYPLIAVGRETPAGPGRRMPYRKPRNIANHFATGLADEYDPSMDAFRDRLNKAVHANNKAALVQTLRDEKLLQAKKPGQTTITWRGQEYEGADQEISPSRIILKDGKAIHTPSVMGIIPRWLASELKPVLEAERIDAQAPTKLMRVINTISLAGPMDAVFHARNLAGVLVANTPFLEDSLGGKIGSLPVLKTFTMVYKIAMTDPTTEEAAAEIIEMAQVGALPTRFASETYSAKIAEQIAAEKKTFPFSFAPTLYGPSGLDIRARLLMWRLAKQINPNATPQELYHFINQMGNYVPALQGEVERFLKKIGFSPFYTAGSTMIRNGLNAFAGTGPVPKGGIGLRVYQALMTGAITYIALWMFLHHALTGKWPQDDKRSKLLKIPVGQGHGPIDKYRHSQMGNWLWGTGPEVGYIDFAFFSPLVMRGARAMGLAGAYETAVQGGSSHQIVESSERDILNSFAHPVLGPGLRAAFVGIAGKEPYLTGFHDRGGQANPQFYPAYPNKLKPGFVGGLSPSLDTFLHPHAQPTTKHGYGAELGAKVGATLGEINSFYGTVGERTGFMGQAEGEKGAYWLRTVLDLGLPGLVGNATNPYSRANSTRIQRQAMGEKAAVGR